jgi:hypothetical protein
MQTMSLNVSKGFTKIDRNVIMDSRLSANAKVMYMMMMTLKANQYAGNAYFQKAMKISQASVTRARKELIGVGLLEVQRVNKLEYRAFLGTSTVSGLEVKRRFYKDELHPTKK